MSPWQNTKENEPINKFVSFCTGKLQNKQIKPSDQLDSLDQEIVQALVNAVVEYCFELNDANCEKKEVCIGKHVIQYPQQLIQSNGKDFAMSYKEKVLCNISHNGLLTYNQLLDTSLAKKLLPNDIKEIFLKIAKA